MAETTIDSPPEHGQSIVHEGSTYTTIKEGLAFILVPPQAKAAAEQKDKVGSNKADAEQAVQHVFYNPIQQFNRDLSVLAIRAYSEDFEVRRRQFTVKKSAQNKNKKEKNKKKSGRSVENDVKSTTIDGANKSEIVDGAHEQVIENVTEDKVMGENAAENKVTAENGLKETEETSEIKKRKHEDVSSEVETANKKMKMESSDITHTESAELNPKVASKLPDGQRPNDKLRKSMRILDALSATGLRALRYASELPCPTYVVANDLLKQATKTIEMNVQHNKLSDKIKASTSDAQAHMYMAAFGNQGHAYGKYDVIDLDPYGTAVPFLDAALLAINDNGLLCVTCTDAGVFNSTGFPEKCYALYGGTSIKGLHAHEGGLRLILNAIATAAGKNGMAIEPLLSLSIDFYARVFVRVKKSPADVKYLAGKSMIVHQCDSGCGAWSIQPMGRFSVQQGKKDTPFSKFHLAQSSRGQSCEFCGFKTHVAGPMWAGPLHNPHFINRILDYLPDLDKETYGTTQRIEGMLTSALEEIEVLSTANMPNSQPSAESTSVADESVNEQENTDSHPSGLILPLPVNLIDAHPFAISPANLSRIVKCRAPPEAAFKGALRHMGFVATRTHTKPGMIKTQAPWGVLWHIMREWVKKCKENKDETLGHVGQTMAGFKILNYEEKESDSAMDIDNVDTTSGNPITSKTQDQSSSSQYGQVIFDERLGRDNPDGKTRRKKLVRWQMNPRANWGPMSRATGSSS